MNANPELLSLARKQQQGAQRTKAPSKLLTSVSSPAVEFMGHGREHHLGLDRLTSRTGLRDYGTIPREPERTQPKARVVPCSLLHSGLSPQMASSQKFSSLPTSHMPGTKGAWGPLSQLSGPPGYASGPGTRWTSTLSSSCGTVRTWSAQTACCRAHSAHQ